MSPGRKQPSRALLLALPLLLPFEAPLASVGPLVLTTAELAIYAVLAAWGLELLAGPRGRVAAGFGLGRGDGPGRAVALWLAVMLASALAAPAHRLACLKFVLRSAGGVLLFFAARDVTRDAAAPRRLAAAVVAGAALSSAVAVAEGVFPGFAPVWRPFRSGAFGALGLPRASGAFAYPTIAAMYWEAALPLAVAVPLSRRPWLRWTLSVAVPALLVLALLLSATRTALVGAAAASLVLLALGLRAGGRQARQLAAAALASIALMAAGAAWLSHADSRLAQRLRFWNDGSWFRARYTPAQARLALPAGAVAPVDLTVENTGAYPWPRAGAEAIALAYHWETRGAGAPRVQLEGRRTPLPADVGPGERVAVRALVNVPRTPGAYLLRWDLVREGVAWFSDHGGATGDQLLDVLAASDGDGRGAAVAAAPEVSGAPEGEVTPGGMNALIPLPAPDRVELWRAAVLLWRRHPLLGVGPDNFRRLHPQVIPTVTGGAARAVDERLHANNLYLETLADLGAAGALALALLMFALGARARAHVTRAAAARGSGDAMVSVAWSVALGTFFVHGLLDYFLEFTPTYGLYWLAAALTAQATAVAAPSATAPSPAPPGSTP